MSPRYVNVSFNDPAKDPGKDNQINVVSLLGILLLGSSVSLARSLDGGGGGLGGGGGGAESGIGTGSPRPPRERRRRPLPPSGADTTHVSVGQQCNMSDAVVIQAPSEEDSRSSSSCSTPSTSSSSGACEVGSKKKRKNRDKVRRRETWEKLRRRHSSGKRTQQPRPPVGRSNSKTGADMVWIPRRDDELTPSPIPPPVPPHAVPVSSSAMEPVRHKPPVVMIVAPSSSPLTGSVGRSKPRPLPLMDPPAESVAAALHSALSMELSSAQSAPFLQVIPKRHPLGKPISASSTPTEPYITLEVRNCPEKKKKKKTS